MAKISAQTEETNPDGSEELVFAKAGANGKMTLANAGKKKSDKFEVFTAGEALVDNDLCYLHTDGKMYKADATDENKIKGLLAFAVGSIVINTPGTFQRTDKKTNAGLSVGLKYYASATPGAISSTPPTTGQFLRVIGFATLITELYININESYYLVD